MCVHEKLMSSTCMRKTPELVLKPAAGQWGRGRSEVCPAAASGACEHQVWLRSERMQRKKAGLRLIQLLLRPGSIGWVRLWSGPEGACRPAQLTINEHGNMAALKALHHRTGLGGVVMFTSSVHLFFCAFRTWSSSLQTHAGASASPHCVSKVGFCSHTLSGTDINDDAEFIKNRLDPEQSFRKLWFLQSLSFRNVKNVSICLDSFENSCYSLHEKNKHFKWQTPLKADFVHHRASLET